MVKRSIGSAKVLRLLYVCILALFLVSPIVTVIFASFGRSKSLSFPPKSFTLHWYIDMFDRGEFTNSLALSILIGVICATVSTLLGFASAVSLNAYSQTYAMSRKSGFRAKVEQFVSRLQSGRMLRNVLLSPMMLPQIVIAVAFLHYFSATSFAYSPLSILLSHVVLTLPFAVMLSEVGIGAVDNLLPKAAESLGSGWFRTLIRVVVPLSKSGIVSAWGFAFIVSFGDATVALLLQGPSSVTIPVQIFNSLYAAPFDPVVAAEAGFVSVFTLVVLAVALLFAERGGEKRSSR